MKARLKKIVEEGGGQFHALQLVPSSLSRTGKQFFIVYFHSPATGSTLALRMAGITPAAVQKHIATSNKLFGK